MKFRHDKCNDMFEGKRVTMQDNENVKFKHKHVASHIQRLNYSSYCSSNFSKCGANKQLCSWKRNQSLWTVGASDTECFVGHVNDKREKK